MLLVDKRLDKLGDKQAGGPIARQGGNRERQTRLRSLQGAVLRTALAESGRGGREDATPALGVHQHQKPCLQGHDVCRGADRPRHRGHHPAGDDGCIPRPRQGDAGRRGARRREAPARRSPSWKVTAFRSNEVTEELITEGVQQFADSFDKLFAAIARRRRALLDGDRAATGDSAGLPGDEEPPSTRKMEVWRAGGRVRRLWAGDKSRCGLARTRTNGSAGCTSSSRN